MVPGRKLVTLATYLLVSLYHGEKMWETERTRGQASVDRRSRQTLKAGRQASWQTDINCVFAFQLNNNESPETI